MKLLVTVLFMLVSAAVGAQSVEPILTPSADDIIFYESFDNIEGTGGNDGNLDSSSEIVKVSDFDNPNTKCFGLKQGCQCVFFSQRGAHYYKTPTLSDIPISKAILSFRMIGRDNYWAGTDYLTISCTDGTLRETSFFAEKGKWNTYYSIADNFTATTQLEFRCAMAFLDDIKVFAVPSSIDQSRNNDTYIIANAGQTLDVPLVRKLTAGIWCPLCLPFEVTKEKMEKATETTCELCILDRVESGIFVFESATTIPAGTPFLVKVPNDVVNPTFTGVTIVNTPAATATASTENYQFVGTYSPVDLETDGTNLFLATDGALYKPTTDGNRLGGLRAYFVVPAVPATSSPARVMIPEIVSDIRNPHDVTPITKYEIYDLRGQRVNNLNSKGLFIHNGKRIFIY